MHCKPGRLADLRWTHATIFYSKWYWWCCWIQCVILLSSVSLSTYQLPCNLLAAAKPKDGMFKQIVDAIQAHHQLKPSVIVEQFNFHSCTRQAGESVSTSVAELCRLSEHCDFGDTLNDMLHDRLVWSINDQKIQRCPLTLTFAKALELAKAAEAANENPWHLQKVTTTGVHHDFHTKEGGARRSTPAASCYRCGGRQLPEKCRFHECHHCGKKVHIAESAEQNKEKCTEKLLQLIHPVITSTVVENSNTVEESNEEPEFKNTILHLPGKRPSPLNNAELDLEVDTVPPPPLSGKKRTSDCGLNHNAPTCYHCHKAQRLQTYTGEELQIQGRIKVGVTYHDQ